MGVVDQLAGGVFPSAESSMGLGALGVLGLLSTGLLGHGGVSRPDTTDIGESGERKDLVGVRKVIVDS